VSKISNNSAGPGFADVADFLIELSREWGGLFRFRVEADRDKRGIPNVFVVLERTPAFGSSGTDKPVRVWSSFPCAANATFAGMLYRLCNELDAKLTRRKVERELQTVF